MHRSTQTPGAIIARLRLAKGFTQQEVSERIGCSRSHLANVERDRTGLSNGLLRGLIETLQIRGKVLKTIVLAEKGRGSH